MVDKPIIIRHCPTDTTSHCKRPKELLQTKLNALSLLPHPSPSLLPNWSHLRGCTPHLIFVTHSHAEPTIIFAVSHSTSAMSNTTHPPTRVLTLMTEFVNSQDGSESFNNLLPTLLDYVSPRVSTRQTAETLKKIHSSVQKRISKLHSTQRATKEAEESYKAEEN